MSSGRRPSKPHLPANLFRTPVRSIDPKQAQKAVFKKFAQKQKVLRAEKLIGIVREQHPNFRRKILVLLGHLNMERYLRQGPYRNCQIAPDQARRQDRIEVRQQCVCPGHELSDMLSERKLHTFAKVRRRQAREVPERAPGHFDKRGPGG